MDYLRKLKIKTMYPCASKDHKPVVPPILLTTKQLKFNKKWLGTTHSPSSKIMDKNRTLAACCLPSFQDPRRRIRKKPKH